MKHLSYGRLAVLCAGLLAAIAASGCDKPGVKFLVPNERPSVDLTAAPLSQADTSWYAYKMNWSGNDPDGRVVRFEYAIDPPREQAGVTQDTLWVSTEKNEEQLFFRATKAYFDPKRGWRSNDVHTFVIRALDDAGAYSAPKWRSFFSYTIAPVVSITNPLPSKLLPRATTPAVRISWTGRDEDGVFSQKPVKYKYRLFKRGDPEYDLERAISSPDSVRTFYAARNFAGWDSVSGDTTFVQYTNLIPGEPHLFVVIGIDEAGAYSPDFSLDGNMLQFTPGFANTLGPVFTVFNEFFIKQYASGGYTDNPLAEIKLEIPAGQPVTFNWVAAPPPGSAIEWYRWKLDGDHTDETPRTNENTDWYHWSRKSVLTTTATVGPFAGGEEHFLYIAAQDNNGLQSLAIVHMFVVQPTFQRNLLIVDDTRLPVDQFPGGQNTPPQQYTGVWPYAAELDTFFYAKGGFPWRGPRGITGTLPPSKPGIFAGYTYDTLGTRLGLEIASAGVPLSKLGEYQHLIWYTDQVGHDATPNDGPETLIKPISYLRWMSAPGRANTVATYVFAGGEMWLAGGTAASITLHEYNKDANDTKYGAKKYVYSLTSGELVPGRMMYDYAHWRSEFVTDAALTTPRKTSAPVLHAAGAWSSPGWKYSRSGSPWTTPDYTLLPTAMRRRALALGDSLPWTCFPTQTQRYFSTVLPVNVEYLTDDNRIIEDFDPSPTGESQQSALDSLYYLAGGQLVTLGTGRLPVTMTYYYGIDSPRYVFTGFDLWSWSRVDIQGLVDFVLQNIWGMTKSSVPTAPAYARPAAATIQQTLPPASTRRSVVVPGGRSGSR